MIRDIFNENSGCLKRFVNCGETQRRMSNETWMKLSISQPIIASSFQIPLLLKLFELLKVQQRFFAKQLRILEEFIVFPNGEARAVIVGNFSGALNG